MMFRISNPITVEDLAEPLKQKPFRVVAARMEFPQMRLLGDSVDVEGPFKVGQQFEHQAPGKFNQAGPIKDKHR